MTECRSSVDERLNAVYVGGKREVYERKIPVVQQCTQCGGDNTWPVEECQYCGSTHSLKEAPRND